MSTRIGFARVGTTGFAAFDLETGRPLAEAKLEGAVVDLEWDDVHSRLLVVSLIGEGEQASVSSYRLEDGDWKHLASSKELSSETHVVVSHGTVVAMSEEMGVSWSVLGDELQHVGMPKLLGRPSGVAALSSTQLVALDPNGGDATHYEDLVRRVGLAPLAESESIAVFAADRPASRWAIVDPGRLVAIVRKHDGESAFETGAIELGAALEAPVFSRRDVPNATGALAAVELDPARARLIALLSAGASAGRIVTLPLDPQVAPQSIQLDGPVETTKWPSRQLVLHAASDTLLIATANGVLAFRGEQPLAGFSGTRYDAPLAVMK